jgi:hypothetical protein
VSREEQIALIAERFATVLLDWLTPDEIVEMRRRNREDPSYSSGACASHDFCDANMAMMEAFESVVGHNMVPSDPNGEISEEDCRLWGDAWEMARLAYLGGRKP